MDEIKQVYCYQLAFAEVKKCALTQQVQPPLDYWLGYFVNKISMSDYAVRLPAAILGTAAVGIVFLILAESVNIYIAFCVAMVYALSPFHIYFSQEARPYSIAIFFLLAMLWVIMNVLSKQTVGIVNFFLLIFTGFIFLITRTFSPLCIVISLCIMIAYLIARSILAKDYVDAKNKFVVFFGLILSIVLYVPFHIQLTEAVKRYSPEAGNISLKLISDGISSFNLLPGLEAYLAQMEPFGYIAAPFIVFALIVNTVKFMKGEINTFTVVAVLFFISILLQLFIYLARTNYDLRPPYLVNIQPFSLLLLAYALDWLQPILSLGEKFGIKMPQDYQNWLFLEDIEHLLYLNGFEVIHSGYRLLIPIDIPILSLIFNKYIAHFPLVRYFCLSNYLIAKPIVKYVDIGSTIPSVSVIIPCRNEKGNIRNAAEKIPNMGNHTEIIFVDGNSTDGTIEEIESIIAEYRGIKDT
jgi:hypothetical protein